MRFFDFAISRFGFVSVSKKNDSYTQETISAYEFEFYTDDFPGGTITDGVFRQARKGCYNLYRPGQTQKLVSPYKCYYMNIVTRDPELCDFLEQLPSGGVVWDMDAVVTLVRKMVSTENKQSISGRFRLQSCVAQILSLLSAQPLSGEPVEEIPVAQRKNLLEVDRYMRNHPGEDLSLNRLAQLSNLDPTYFHKLYTKAYGKTPAQQTVNYRIVAAKLALAEGRMSISEVAAQCGFSSQAYFCNKFRQITGKTPTEYRKSIFLR